MHSCSKTYSCEKVYSWFVHTKNNKHKDANQQTILSFILVPCDQTFLKYMRMFFRVFLQNAIIHSAIYRGDLVGVRVGLCQTIVVTRCPPAFNKCIYYLRIVPLGSCLTLSKGSCKPLSTFRLCDWQAAHMCYVYTNKNYGQSLAIF